MTSKLKICTHCKGTGHQASLHKCYWCDGMGVRPGKTYWEIVKRTIC